MGSLLGSLELRITKFQIVTVLVALFLGGAHLALGASLVYVALLVVFILTTYLAIQAAGGFSSYYGYLVAAYAIQHVIFSQFAKIAMKQPGDYLLDAPVSSMGAYIATMASFAAGGWLYQKLVKKRKLVLFEPIESLAMLRGMTIVSMVLAAPVVLLSSLSRSDDGTNVGGSTVILFSAVGACAIVCGTAHAIVASKGKKTFDALSLTAGSFIVIASFVSATRQGFIIPLATYFATCLAFGYRFKIKQYALFACFAVFFQLVIFPWANISRGIIRSQSAVEAFKTGSSLLVEAIVDPQAFRNRGIQNIKAKERDKYYNRTLYYGKEVGAAERYSLIKTTDLIVDATNKTKTWGLVTIIPGFKQLAPTFLVPDKSNIHTGTLLAHRAKGLVGDHDYTTGITCGLTADAYSSFSWYGVLLIPGMLMFLYLTIFSYLFRLTLQRNIFLLATFFQTGWIFAEGPFSTHLLAALQAPILQSVMFAILVFLARLLCPRPKQSYSGPTLPDQAQPIPQVPTP